MPGLVHRMQKRPLRRLAGEAGALPAPEHPSIAGAVLQPPHGPVAAATHGAGAWLSGTATSDGLSCAGLAAATGSLNSARAAPGGLAASLQDPQGCGTRRRPWATPPVSPERQSRLAPP